MIFINLTIRIDGVLTVQDSADEHPQVEQSTRASKSLRFAGLATARLASMVTTVM